MKYSYKLSHWLNALFGGKPHQSICARQFNTAVHVTGCWRIVNMLDKIFWFDHNHCAKAWLHWKDQERLLK